MSQLSGKLSSCPPYIKGGTTGTTAAIPAVPLKRDNCGTTGDNRNFSPYSAIFIKGTTERKKAIFEVTKNCAEKCQLSPRPGTTDFGLKVLSKIPPPGLRMFQFWHAFSPRGLRRLRYIMSTSNHRNSLIFNDFQKWENNYHSENIIRPKARLSSHFALKTGGLFPKGGFFGGIFPIYDQAVSGWRLRFQGGI